MDKCPFCTSHLTKKKNFCLSCNTFSKDALFIDDEIRKKTSFPLVKRDILDNSIKILEKDYSRDPRDLITLFNLALSYLNTGRHEDSVKLWKEFIKLSPKKSIALNNMGVSYLCLGKPELARLALEKAHNIFQNSPTINYNLGSLYRMNGDMQKAASFYRIYDNNKPGNPFIKEFLEKYDTSPPSGEEYKDKKNPLSGDVEAEEEDVLSISKSSGSINKDVKKEPLPELAEKNRKSLLPVIGIIVTILSVAIIIFSVKYYIDNTGPDARDRKAETYYYRAIDAEKSGDLNRAIEYGEKAINLKQDYPEAHNYLAKLYDKKGELNKAIRELEIAVKINPVYAEAYSNLAEISKKMNYTVNAGEYGEMAKQNFKLKEVLLKQAFEYYTNGQGSIAIEPLKKAINIDPEDAKLYYNLALVYLKSGFLEDCRRELKKAIKIAEYKEQKEFVSLFSNVLSNLNSDDLVVDFIISNQPSYAINTPSLIPTKPPLNSVTTTPVSQSTGVSRPTVSLPPPGEDPQVAAVDTMNMFFQSIDGKDYNQAYSLLSAGWQKEVSLNDFSAGFSSTSNFNVSSVRILETTDNAIKVKVYFTANKQSNKGNYLAAYQGVYLLVWTGQGWKIDAGAMEEKTLENQENTETF